MKYESPVINGDGTHSRDFTYIDNVLQMNELALSTTNANAIGEEFNTAVGERADMNKMMVLLKTNLVKHDPQIANIEVIQGSERKGDIPQALANITNAKNILGYQPSHNLEKGFSAATDKLLNVTGIT